MLKTQSVLSYVKKTSVLSYVKILMKLLFEIFPSKSSPREKRGLSYCSPPPQFSGQITYSPPPPPNHGKYTIMGGYNFMGGYNGTDPRRVPWPQIVSAFLFSCLKMIWWEIIGVPYGVCSLNIIHQWHNSDSLFQVTCRPTSHHMSNSRQRAPGSHIR